MTASDGEATERKTFHLPAVANEWVQEENEAAAASELGQGGIDASWAPVRCGWGICIVYTYIHV